MILSFKDQLNFAKLSHDFNPLHCDEILSRRYIYGEPAVHGINVMILAIQEWSNSKNSAFIIEELKCKFIKPIFLNKKIKFKIIENCQNIKIKVFQEDELKIKLGFLFNSYKDKFNLVNPFDVSTATSPENNSFEQLRNYSKIISISIDKKNAKEIYSASFIDKIGYAQLAEIVSYSRIIGMHAPGLNSIFSELNVQNKDQKCSNSIAFRVTDIDERFKIIYLECEGRLFNAHLKAFYRPPLVSQKNINEISKYVKKDEFVDQRALIVGGSRGLGEFTAKCLGYGGAQLFLSYFMGNKDTLKILKSIKDHNNRLNCFSLDVTNITESDLKKIRDFNPTHVYYFATPFIFQGSKNRFDEKIFKRFKEFYVDAFEYIIEYILNINLGEDRYVFYPSSVAINNTPNDMLEYVKAKKEGEMSCLRLEEKYDNLKIYKPRLPRLETDQTVSLSSVKNEDPIAILEIIRSMNS